MVRALDMGQYFRVPADIRDLNYAKYFSEGENRLAEIQDYHSHNVPRLEVGDLVELLLKLPYIGEELARDSGTRDQESEIKAVKVRIAQPTPVNGRQGSAVIR
jgi:UDP-glucose 4-epimerase